MDLRSIYQGALDACRASKSRLAKYLPADNILLLPDEAGHPGAKKFDAIAVERFIQERHREATDRLEQSKIKWLSDATSSFASVAIQLSELLDPLVPQSPEYTIPFGCLMIIFKVVRYTLSLGHTALTNFRFWRRSKTSVKRL